MPRPEHEPAWMRWYGLQRWRDRATLQMKMHPLCAMCIENKIWNPARVADHIIPHKGNQFLFWYGKLQSLCHEHHSGSKRQLECKGFTDDIGVDGFPVDAEHPFNKLPKRD